MPSVLAVGEGGNTTIALRSRASEPFKYRGRVRDAEAEARLAFVIGVHPETLANEPSPRERLAARRCANDPCRHRGANALDVVHGHRPIDAYGERRSTRGTRPHSAGRDDSTMSCDSTR
jgi:hypothetical protein